ncbi:MAG: cation-translocating P-type ATPase [Bacteroidetes bacterium]|nr:cation-translocating P-type ATPase [Bacteroidota bacterium]
MENKVLLNVEGMDCANCAMTITRTLQKSGYKEVNVNFATGEVLFDIVESVAVTKAVGAIEQLGYHVTARSDAQQGSIPNDQPSHSQMMEWKFLFSLVFTIPLLAHMFLPFPILHQAWFQLAICSPVMALGVWHFGKSAFYSIRAGVPNMDVLIIIGSSSAFIYSSMQMYAGDAHPILFFETAATIITLVLMGNLIEHRSVKQTTTSIGELSKLQVKKAKKIITDGSTETIVEINTDELVKDDLVQINSGDRVPADGIILSGTVLIDESMITGESLPVTKTNGDAVTGGTLLEDGTARVTILKNTKDSALSKIIELVKMAQHDKPAIQRLGDRISAIFVPVVVSISILTFFVSHFGFDIPTYKAVLNSIAVLVISCPCAMGLATPTAVMAGIGRAAKNGILIRGGSTLEQLASVKTIVFDKTGTLTTGHFKIKAIQIIDGNEDEIKRILYSAEIHSSHPIAKSICKELRSFESQKIVWKDVHEDKGIGINVTANDGTLYSIGSFQMVRHFYTDHSHSIYVLRNNKLIATVDLQDEIKPGTQEMISTLKKAGMNVVMVSGDRKANAEHIAAICGIDTVFSEQLPSQKSAILQKLSSEKPTAMIGDGINDAPALAMATVRISISNATDVAIQSSQVILLDRNDLTVLLKAIQISKLTYSTIKQNLFWAFCYNVIAIPIAAAGYLNPMIGALSMAFSDVIVIGNSLRLKTRRIS